jgi:hypothetical protein
MIFNRQFLNSIEPVLSRLKTIFGDDFVVFGSAPLYLLDIINSGDKHLNDLDIAVRDLRNIPDEAIKKTFQKNPDQILYQLKIDGVKIDIGTCWPGQEDFFARIFHDPIVANGYKFADLLVVKEWKEKMVKEYQREKDMEYLKRINDFLTRV